MERVMHQIGEGAEAVGLWLRTIRHYEEVGVVHASGRTAVGLRLYTDADVERLRFSADEAADLTLEEYDLLQVPELSANVAGEDRESLVGRLAMYVTAGHAGCGTLPSQPESAEAVTATLQREVSRSRRASGSRP